MAGLRMLEPACGPCVGMGQAPPSGANSLRTFNRNFPGRSGTADDQVYLCSPAVAAASMLNGRDRRPARAAGCRTCPSAHRHGRLSSRRTSSRRRRRRKRLDRDPARPEHQAAARAGGAARRARDAGADRRARRHLDRRPLARRRDRDGVPLERARDRRVHLPAPRPRVPAPREGVGRRLHRRRRQLRPGLEPRARRARAVAARRARRDREELRAHPPAQPDRAGDRPAALQGRGRLRQGRAGADLADLGPARDRRRRSTILPARSRTQTKRSRSPTTCCRASGRSSSPAGLIRYLKQEQTAAA